MSWFRRSNSYPFLGPSNREGASPPQSAPRWCEPWAKERARSILFIPALRERSINAAWQLSMKTVKGSRSMVDAMKKGARCRSERLL